MLISPSSIDLSTRTLRYLTGQLVIRRQEIGTRWRRLTAGRQALLALAHLRYGATHSQLAAGFGIGIAAAFRYIREAVEVLAALAPSLAEAMKTIRTKGFVILDGTLLPIDRIAANTPYFSGKRKRHGMNVQVITDPFDRLLWASPALPGSTHDLTPPDSTESSRPSPMRTSNAGPTTRIKELAGRFGSRSGAAASSDGNASTTAATPRSAASVSRP